MKSLKMIHRQPGVSVTLYRRVERTMDASGRVRHPYTTNERIGTRTGSIGILIDVDALIREYGARALLNKSRRSQLAGGAIVFEAVGCEDHIDPTKEAGHEDSQG